MKQIHKITGRDGLVHILKRLPKSRIAHGGFIWPEGVGTVVKPSSFSRSATCGNGLHGWPWGFGLGEGSDFDVANDIWLVIGARPSDVVGKLEGGPKCKCRKATILFEGTYKEAMDFMYPTREWILKECGGTWRSPKCRGAIGRYLSASCFSVAQINYGNCTVVSSGLNTKHISAGSFSTHSSSGTSSIHTSRGSNAKHFALGDNSVVVITERWTRFTLGKGGVLVVAAAPPHGKPVTSVMKVGRNGLRSGVEYHLDDNCKVKSGPLW